MKIRRLALSIAFLVAAAIPARAAIGEWVAGEKASVRLLAAGVDADGNLSGGIEIELEPGWHTYWRSPGDAGMAPVIDFAGSLNIAEPSVAFPAPHRLDDGYAASNVYEDRIVFPFTTKLDNPGAATDLALKLDIGVCAEVCVPEHFEAKLSVPATKTDLAAEKILTAAMSAVPGRPEPNIFAVTGLVRAGGTDKRPVFEIRAKVPDAESAALFVEGPADWYAAPPVFVSESDGVGLYRVEFDRLTAKSPIEGAAIRITIVAGSRAIEQTVRLD
jgi:suppressor for copper-sensitivity B